MHSIPQPSRRDWLRTVTAGFGYMAFAGLATASAARDNAGPLAPKAPHFPARAKRVIFLCMRGGPSHMETFDPKPHLTAAHGKVGRRANTKLLGSRWDFRQHGQSGTEIVNLLPEIGKHADKLCVLRGMQSDNENHPQALEQLHTGSFQFVRPSMGAWTLYGLGTENQNLPGFISINPLTALGGLRYYSSSFLPAAYSATLLGDANQPSKPIAIEGLKNPRVTTSSQRAQLDLLARMNRKHLAGREHDSRLEARIQSFELAWRMQSDAEDAFDISRESQSVRDMYGPGVQGRQMLIARRLVERGVRFVQVWHGAGQPWDNHDDIEVNHRRLARECDQAIGALLADLERRGMLDDTLVIWGGEFGRTPTVELPTAGANAGKINGRDHNHHGYSIWMAGGGSKGGYVHGATDEFGFQAVENKVHVHDLQATIMHLLGFDHEKLTYRHAGRDFRLTDVHGRVIKELLA